MGLYGNDLIDYMKDDVVVETVTIQEGLFKKIRDIIKGKNSSKKTKEKKITTNTTKENDDDLKVEFKVAQSPGELHSFYQNDGFLAEGLYIKDQKDGKVFIDAMSKRFKFKSPVKVYSIMGPTMNNTYDLEGSNKYPTDFHFIYIPFEAFDKSVSLPEVKAYGGGFRYYRDVIDNNEYREYQKGRHKKNEYADIDWLIDAFNR